MAVIPGPGIRAGRPHPVSGMRAERPEARADKGEVAKPRAIDGCRDVLLHDAPLAGLGQLEPVTQGEPIANRNDSRADQLP